jgi:hypothetical protein
LDGNDLQKLNNVNDAVIIASESGIIDYSQLLEKSSNILNNLEVLKQSTATIDATTMANDLSKISNANILLEHSHDITLDGNDLQKLNQVNDINIIASESGIIDYSQLLETSSQILNNLEVLKQSTATLDATTMANDLSKISNANIILEHSHDITLDGNDLQKLNQVNDINIITSESNVLNYSDLLEKSSKILNNLEVLKQSTSTIDATTMGKELSELSNVNIILEHSHDITLDAKDLHDLNQVNNINIITSESNVLNYGDLLEKSSKIINNLVFIRPDVATLDASILENNLQKLNDIHITTNNNANITIDASELKEELGKLIDNNMYVNYSNLLFNANDVLHNINIIGPGTSLLDGSHFGSELQKLNDIHVTTNNNANITIDASELKEELGKLIDNNMYVNYSDLLLNANDVLHNINIIGPGTSLLDGSHFGSELDKLNDIHITTNNNANIIIDASELKKELGKLIDDNMYVNYSDLLLNANDVLHNVNIIGPGTSLLDGSHLGSELKILNNIQINTEHEKDVVIDASELKEELSKLIDDNMYLNYSDLLLNSNDILHNINIIGPDTSLLDGSHLGSELKILNNIQINTEHEKDVVIDASELKEELSKLIDDNIYMNYSNLLLNANDVLKNMLIYKPSTVQINVSELANDLNKISDVSIVTEPEKDDLILQPLFHAASNILNNMIIQIPEKTIIDSSELADNLNKINKINIETLNPGKTIIYSSELADNLNKINNIHIETQYSDKTLIDSSEFINNLNQINNIHIKTQIPEKTTIDSSELMMGLNQINNINIDTQKQVPYFDFSNLLSTASVILNAFEIYKGFNGDYHVLVIFKFVISHTVNKERTKKTYVVKTIKENVINMEDSTEIKKIAKIWKLKKINFGELVVNNSQVDTNNIPKDSETKMVHDKIKNVLTTKDIVTNNYNTMALHVVINRKNNKQNKHIIHSVYVR